jgi:predicted Ser/Thr protein kinase
MPEGTEERAVRIGEVLGGRYEVERVLGEGGMGIVVAARHIELGQRVALKFMLPRREASPGSRERFLQEARAAVRLRSQHVAKVTDIGTLKRGESGDESPFIVMEYLEGKNLDAVLEERWPIPIEEAVEYVLHACEAVGEAHALDIVHRDLKPANLFLTKNADGSPCVKVLDFGLSKLTSTAELSASLTKTNATLGTPHYMAPEQMRSSKHVDARADIWALGVIAYELLTREVPFDAETVTELCARVLEDEPLSPSRHRPKLPAELEQVVLKCLHKDPAERWQSAAALAAALAPFASPRAASYGVRVANVMAEASSASSSGDGAATPSAGRVGPTGSVTGAAWHTSPVRRGRLGAHPRVLVAGGAVAVVAIGLWLAMLGPGASKTPDAGSTVTSGAPGSGEPQELSASDGATSQGSDVLPPGPTRLGPADLPSAPPVAPPERDAGAKSVGAGSPAPRSIGSRGAPRTGASSTSASATASAGFLPNYAPGPK